MSSALGREQRQELPPKDEQPAANGETAKENMGEKTDEMPMDAEKPTITFVHGYYHDESEWPAAAQMRQIYQDFADMHKDEFTFVAIPDESGAEGIYNTALNDISGGKFYDIADFGGWNIVPVASAAGLILDLKPYLDEDAGFKAGAGVCYDQNLTADGKIYSVREQIEAVGFWYNEALFAQAGAKVPADWSTWADFEEAVDKLVDAGITPFGLNAGWPTNILTAGRFQADEATRAFYAQGAEVASFDDPAFREVMTFMQEKVLQKIDASPQFHGTIRSTCILGGIYTNPADFGTSYQEAKRLIPKKDILPNPKHKKVLSATAMGIYQYLFNNDNHDEILNYCNERLGKLEEYDHANGTFLLDTLLAYYMNGFSVGKTAKELFIHRNSLQYRLNKIQELIDFELDDYMEYLDMINCILIKQLMFS